MVTVGITGGIGSGKSTVCRIFELLGVPVFYSDDEAKKLYDDPVVKAKVRKLFGAGVFGKGGRVDKARLASVVFSNSDKLQALNSIIHPAVRKRFLAWRKLQRRAPLVMKEAAILLESGADKDVNVIISVISSKILRINRLKSYKNISPVEAEKRMNEQMSDAERRRRSDFVIVNDERHSLVQQVLDLHKKLLSKK